MKIAQYQRVLASTSSYVTLLTQQQVEQFPELYTGGDYVRLSEWTEVTFAPRPPEEYVHEQLSGLDRAEAELRQKFADKLAEVDEQRAKLLALTHQPTEAVS